jgi:membrane protein YqaA with SNARE-associated domain
LPQEPEIAPFRGNCYIQPNLFLGDGMLRRLYDWILEQADRPHAIWVMGAMSFAESSFFPLPPDFLLVPMMLADRRRIFWLATVATATSVVGGYLGYAIGYYAFDTFGHFIITTLASQAGFDSLQQKVDDYGFWAIAGKGLTPFPYKIVTIFCGFVHYNLLKFTLASILARSVRFYFEAIVLYRFGERGKVFIEERLTLVTAVAALVIVLIIGGFVAIRYI